MLKESKNIDLAKIQFDRLRLFINDCNPQVSEIATSAGRYIEAALYTKEINETEYIDNIEKLRKENNRFKSSCKCISLK